MGIENGGCPAGREIGPRIVRVHRRGVVPDLRVGLKPGLAACGSRPPRRESRLVEVHIRRLGCMTAAIRIRARRRYPLLREGILVLLRHGGSERFDVWQGARRDVVMI